MPALVGEAAVRIVPSVRNFKARTESELKALAIKAVSVTIEPNLKEADAKLDAWRAEQRARGVNIPVKTDLKGLQRDLTQVQHIFERNALSRAIRFNVVVAGLDALPALAYAAGSATSALDALGKSAFALPGLLGGALASVGALAVGVHGLKDAFKAYGEDEKNAAQNTQKISDANRDVERSYRSYRSAVRDTIREIQDLNAENRRSSLNVADAVLSVEEAAQKLREGGQRSLLELRRDQFSYVESLDHLQEVRTKAFRTAQDAADANAKGVAGNDKVVDALDAIAKSAEKLNESNVTKVSEALAKLSPNAKATVEALHAFNDEWKKLEGNVQDNLFAGIDRDITDLGRKSLPGLQVGLSRVATGFNSNFREILHSLGNDRNQSLVQRIFGDTGNALDNLSRGMNPLVSGLINLMSSSATFLPRLGDAADKVFTRFDAFTERISSDGSLNKWIDSGLKALDQLGNTVLNIGSIVSSVSQAFDTASGHSGGFVKNLDDATKKLADFLKTGKGQQDLVSYFQQARDLITEIKSAFTDIRPVLHDVVTAGRDWSKFLLEALGLVSQLATWLDKGSGAIKYLVLGFAAIRTGKPIWDALTKSAAAYNTVTQALARNSTFGKYFDKQAANLRALRGEFDENATAVGRFVTTVDKDGNKVIKQVGDAAKTSGSKIGGMRRSVGQLTDKIGLLSSVLGPQAALLIGITTATTVLDKLGEAHRNAAADAAAQKQQLDQLKQSLDGVTGSASNQTVADVATQGTSFPAGGLGKRNSLQDFERTGLGSQHDIVSAALPQNQGQRDKYQGDLNRITKDKIAGSQQWREFGDVWQKNGVDLDTIALASNGNQDALNKVHEAEKKMFGAPRDQLDLYHGFDFGYQSARIAGHFAAPDLTSLVKDAGAYDSVSASLFLAGASNSLSQAGASIQQANRAALPASFTPAGASLFGPAGGDQSHLFVDPATHLAQIRTDRDPGVDPQLGETQQVPGGFQVNLTADGMKQFVTAPGFADGGMVRGSGGPREDNIPIMASAGEQITNADAVRYYGSSLFNALNQKQVPRFDWGGWFKPPGIHDNAAPAAPAPSILGPRPPLPPVLHGEAQSSTPPLGGAAVSPGGGGKPSDKIGGFFGGIADWWTTNVSHSDPTFTNLPKPTQWTLDHVGLGANSGHAPPSATGLGSDEGSSFLDVVQDSLSTRDNAVGPAPGLPKPAPAPTPSGAAPSTHLTGTAPGPAPHRPSSRGPGPAPGPTPSGPALAGAPRARSRAGAPILAPPGLPGIPAGTPLPVGVGNESGLQNDTIRAKRSISAAFPQIGDIGGWRPPDGFNEHSSGQAIDVMLPGDYSSPEGRALGEQIKAYALSHASEFGIDYVLYNQTQWNPDGSSSGMDDRGSDNENHRNHLHIHTIGGGYPTGAEQFLAPAGGGPAGLPGLPGVPGIGQRPGPNIAAAFKKLPSGLQPQKLAGQVGDIALQTLGGFFGLDFSYLKDAQSVGNFYLGKLGGKKGNGGKGDDGPASFLAALGLGPDPGDLTDDGSGSDLTNGLYGSQGDSDSAISDALGQFTGASTGQNNGQLPLDGPQDNTPDDIDFNQNLIGLAGKGGGKGSEQWRPLVRQVLQAYGPRFGITTPQQMKVWEDKLVTQIETESSGDAGAVSPDGDVGLLQFKPGTFGQFNVTGGDIHDPTSQVLAALNRLTKGGANAYSMQQDGGPAQIGQGVGWSTGGSPDSGAAWVSAGEYRNSPETTAYYGPALFDALNAKAIPRSQVGGFASGGWPLDLIPDQPSPGASPNGPLPGPGPAPTAPAMPSIAPPSLGGDTAPPGPAPGLDTTAPIGSPPIGLAGVASGPSTGGAPGPGATAPAPDPGTLPGVADALTNIGGAGAAIGSPTSIGSAQPGTAGTGDQPDPRATLGAAPASQDHESPALSQGVSGAFSTVGNLVSTAAQLAIDAGTAGAGGPAGGAAASGINAAFQMGGQVANGVINILSSLLVGTATGGSVGPATGIPLLPQRQPVQNGVAPIVQRVHQGDINVTNLDEYQRMQQRIDAQQAMPYISKYGE